MRDVRLLGKQHYGFCKECHWTLVGFGLTNHFQQCNHFHNILFSFLEAVEGAVFRILWRIDFMTK